MAYRRVLRRHEEVQSCYRVGSLRHSSSPVQNQRHLTSRFNLLSPGAQKPIEVRVQVLKCHLQSVYPPPPFLPLISLFVHGALVHIPSRSQPNYFSKTDRRMLMYERRSCHGFELKFPGMRKNMRMEAAGRRSPYHCGIEMSEDFGRKYGLMHKITVF